MVLVLFTEGVQWTWLFVYEVLSLRFPLAVSIFTHLQVEGKEKILQEELNFCSSRGCDLSMSSTCSEKNQIHNHRTESSALWWSGWSKSLASASLDSCYCKGWLSGSCCRFLCFSVQSWWQIFSLVGCCLGVYFAWWWAKTWGWEIARFDVRHIYFL